MGEFKKFIQTNGKSFDEIKKTINEMVNRAVNSVVDTVVDDVTQFAPKDVRKSVKQSVKDIRKKAAEGGCRAEKIPPRLGEPKQADDKTEFVYKSSAPAYSQIHYPHEAHSENMPPQEEHMLAKIGQMRELEICVRGQGIVKRAVELTMVEQGDFMADVEDDFTRRAFCALPQPVYAAMSNSQLRTFFTWRTDARRGRYFETDKPYVLLYCYELLNKIGMKSSTEAFDKLLEVWENCRAFAPYLNALMPRWLKDFYAFNDVTEKYPDINAVFEQPSGNGFGCLEREFSEIEAGNYSGKFNFWAENSAYDIKGSKFYSEQTKPLIDAACEAALKALDAYFGARDIELSELVCGKLKKDYSWIPFKDAIVNLDTADGFRPVKISASERYCIKRGEPALELFDFSPSRGFIGYLLKSVEAELRIKTGFNRRITPKLQMVQNDLQNRTRLMEATSEPDFLKVIPKAVDEYCLKNGIRPAAKLTKPRQSRKAEDDEYTAYVAPKVEIDITKLEEIRDKSDELARKLIIDETEEQNSNILGYSDDRDNADVMFEAPDTAEQIASQIVNDEFSVQIEEYKEELSPQEDEELPLQSGDPIFEGLDRDWQIFANNLTPIHLEVLKALLNGSVRSCCKERGLLPETVFEEINTEALSAFGDVVIECAEIVSDYSDEISKIVKSARI